MSRWGTVRQGLLLASSILLLEGALVPIPITAAVAIALVVGGWVLGARGLLPLGLGLLLAGLRASPLTWQV